MRLLSWLDGLNLDSSRRRTKRGRPRGPAKKPAGCKLFVEPLECRTVPAFLTPVDYTAGTYPYSVVAADFNGDHVLDLAVANPETSTVSVLRGIGDGTFQTALTSPTGYSPRSIAVGDLNGDGNLDLATADYYDVTVLLGNGDGTFGAPSNIGFAEYPSSVAVGDFTGDGLMDLGVTSAYYYAYASVLAGDGTGNFSGPNETRIGHGYFPSAIAVNLDGVGADELVTANDDYGPYYYGAVYVLAVDGSGFLQVSNVLHTDTAAWSVAAGDVNGDGAIDLVTANGYYYDSVSVLLGDGVGGFGAAQTYAAGSYPVSVVLGDFTGDGNVDIATANYHSTDVSVLYGGGDGTFSNPAKSPTGSYPYSIAAGDFNGDGWLDAATGNPNGGVDLTGDVSVLINDQFWSPPPPPPPPSVSINDVTVTEGNTGTTNATFTIYLSKAYSQDVTVHYATADATATAGSDYAAASGDVTIAAGQTTKTFTVAVLGDRSAEPTENFVVNLSAATNGLIVDSQGIGTIVDDEPRISISDVSKKEGKRNQTTLFIFTVTLSAAYDQPVTMSFRTVNDTAKTSDGDYVAKTGTLTFAPGETTKTITIDVKGDNRKEANETFYLDLSSNSGNSWFTKSRGVGTILNDD
jgi:hypothetical protein